MSNIKQIIRIILFIQAIFLNGFVFSQEELDRHPQDSLRMMFYNVENLFDPFDDSLTSDEEFTEEGAKHWSWYKYQDKLSNIYKTIVAVGNPYPPAIIGLCEIENRFVLNQLVYKTPFSKFDYRIVHEESPDRRGIDVGLLFDPKRAELIYHEAVRIDFHFSPQTKTRDILYVKLRIFNEDTIHIFVNHWPSRWGGQMASAPKRNYVADILRVKIDSIFNEELTPSIFVMGDFNDEPEDESLRLHLEAGSPEGSSRMVNVMLPLVNDKSKGTHKYQANWGILDQFIVSKFLLLSNNQLQINLHQNPIFAEPYLLEKDEKFLGLKPNRTFIGYKYHGGFSDHLPIFLDLYKMQ
ncbi:MULTISPECIES: endonuclease [unclassified Lentimicrobium]|uniref:endonuclease/exonuclease/phosphatase family protein n=1 Tax=unclassified Lentimicrobium TaxID=2677434 RepID=UPI001554AD65|nr:MULTISPECIES: endonuclease [unclassified Lentimicrobium]NPD46479.1 endonuclease [Lentimicrobium sp. S6]NPD85985.1 endonuclease [Lentimicrobium sp. L6]